MTPLIDVNYNLYLDKHYLTNIGLRQVSDRHVPGLCI